MLSSEPNILTWREVDAKIRLAVNQALDNYDHHAIIKRVTYARLAPSIIAGYLRSGRDNTELLAQMFEQGILVVNTEDQY